MFLSAFMTMEEVLIHAADITQGMWLCLTVTKYQLKSTLHIIFKRIIRGIRDYGHRHEKFPPPKTSTPATSQPILLLFGTAILAQFTTHVHLVPRLRMCASERLCPIQWIGQFCLFYP